MYGSCNRTLLEVKLIIKVVTQWQFFFPSSLLERILIVVEGVEEGMGVVTGHENTI